VSRPLRASAVVPLLLLALGALVCAVLERTEPAVAQDPSGFPVTSPPARSARVVYGDGRSSTVTLMQLALPSMQWYMAGSDLADILQVGRYWRTDVRKLVLRIGEQRITFTVGARAVVATDATLMMRNEVVFHQGEPWIPLEFLTKVLGQLTDRAVQWNDEDFSLRLGEKEFSVTGLTIDTGDLHTELRV
jgi:hypothetical protein